MAAGEVVDTAVATIVTALEATAVVVLLVEVAATVVIATV